MAAFVKVWCKRDQTLDIIIHHSKEAEVNSEKEYKAAVRIQSWFRGCRIRAYLKHLHQNATEIQRCYRGYMGRKNYRRVLKESLHRMREDYYQLMAVKIQSCWRGFYVRLRVFDYRAFSDYMKALRIKNQQVRDRLKEVHDNEEAERAQLALQMNELKLQEDASRCHHMLSTMMMDGVFKSTRRSFENRMRKMRFAPQHPVRIHQAEEVMRLKQQRDECMELYAEQRHRKFRHCHCKGNLSPSTSTSILESVREDISGDKDGGVKLPPLVCVQGPFKDPAEVLWQKIKPLEPTIRVASDYRAVQKARKKLKEEEWKNRVINTPFVVPHPNKCAEPYGPLIHTSHPRRDRPDPHMYRENDPHRNMSSYTFTTLIPPIPLFDKFNRTY